MRAPQVANIVARVKVNIKQLEAERDDLLKEAMNRDRLAQSFKQILAGPRGVLTPIRRGQLILMLDEPCGGTPDPGEKYAWKRGAEVAEFLNSSGWRFTDKHGKARNINKRDVDNGFASLDL